MSDVSELAAINRCVDLLMTKLVTKEDELFRRTKSSSGNFSQIDADILRAEIAVIKMRLHTVERWQEELLSTR